MNAFRPKSGWRRTWWLSLALLGACFLPCRQAPAGEPAPRPEHEIKALYLYNFTRFVDWPTDSNARSNTPAPFRFGIVGAAEVARDLEEITRQRTFKERPIQIRQVTTALEAKQCQIVFLAASDRTLTLPLLRELGTEPVLTVGEGDDFLRDGGMITFIRHEKNVRLQVNPEAAQRAGLSISSRLRSVAEVYRPPKAAP